MREFVYFKRNVYSEMKKLNINSFFKDIEVYGGSMTATPHKMMVQIQ